MNRVQILHLNVGKRRNVQNSLLNDATIKDFQAVAVVEPYIFANPENDEPTIPQDHRWQIYRPTTLRQDVLPRFAFRTAIWVNARCKATQIPAACSDTTAVLIDTGETHLLLVASYEPRDGVDKAGKEQAMRARIQSITEVRRKADEEVRGTIDFLICADWNRYHPLWGGPEVLQRSERAKEGEQIVSFMHQNGLRSLLAAGTPTWEHATQDQRSTIDLILGSEGIQDRLITCGIHEIDHGSDHKAIVTKMRSAQTDSPRRKGKRLYRDADWDRIRTYLENTLAKADHTASLTNAEELEDETQYTTTTITQALEELVPRARESPYNKRWWTRELTGLRDEYTTRRNRVTTLRRRGDDTEKARKLASSARRTFHNAIDRQKRDHWKDFLDDPENIWKAARYAKRRETTTQMPDLVEGEERAKTDTRKAEILMEAFFPIPPEPEGDSRYHRRPGQSPDWPELTMHEIETAIFKSSQDKAPGPDEITFRAWREIWPVVGPHLLKLYKASLELGYVPNSWKTVKIVVLRKPGKADYTKPKAYRPISLIPTISKGLEAVVAARLSYIVEHYKLLPDNHFGARPKRSAEQALNLVIEKIYQAWRRRKILTLVSFDVKGAFNGVHRNVLEQRLRARRVPEQAVQWIRDFCSHRRAQVTLGSYESEPKDIEYPGIPQGSPLSPLLYIFYNADLVERTIDKNGGAIGFVDDFNAWVVGDNERQTTRLIQSTIIPHAEQWAKQSGAIFETDKTSLIHFTRRKTWDDTGLLYFGSDEIKPQEYVKVLGVTLDKRLTMYQHVSKVANKATYACIALRGIKGVRPAQARQLYRSCVLPIIDYAASTWYGPGKGGITKLIKMLEKTQRLGARGILRAWKTVSLPVLEAEAHLEDTETRLDKKVAKYASKIFTLDSTHPMRKAVKYRKGQHYLCSPLQATVREHADRIRPCSTTTLQSNPTWARPPWKTYSNRVEIQEKSKALETARLLKLAGYPTLYTDAASGERLIGYAIVLVRGQEVRVVQKESIGWSSTASVLGAELVAIAEAIDYAWRHITDTLLVVMSDSQHALRAIAQGYGHGSKQAQVARITRSLQRLDEKGVHTNFRWVPAHAGVEGNERADQAAKEVSRQPGTPTRAKAERQREVEGVIALIHRDIDDKRQREPHQKMPGQHTWKIDKALPGKHTLKLYGALSSDQTSILIQARTGHCRLNKSLFTKGLRESARCGCGRGDETVEHVLLACPNWADQRRTLRESVGDRCNDVPFLLGGYGTRKVGQSDQLLDGKRENWAPDIKVVKATIEFLQSTGRFEYTRVLND